MSRKYRQQGYQDSDRRDDKEPRKAPPPRKKPLTPEEKARVRGTRHATQREANEVVRCPTCGTNVQALGAIVPETNCPQCHKPLHCCRACRQFDSSARWECRAEITERIGDKLERNRCNHFSPRLVLDATGKRVKAPAPNDPKSRFDSLFKS
jgi:hypothetical protein